MLLQPLRWRCVECVIHHEQDHDVREKQHHIYVVQTRVISWGDLYCCLLPQSEALQACSSVFLIATVYNVVSFQSSPDIPICIISSALILLNFNFASFIRLITCSISALECGIG